MGCGMNYSDLSNEAKGLIDADIARMKAEQKEKPVHIAMLSGGRDSTAMVFMLIDKGLPLDHVIFTDTYSEFPEMYEYLNRVNERLRGYGHKLEVLTHKRNESFEDWCFGKVTKGKREGFIRGLPMVTQPCYWKREAKVYPLNKFLKDNLIYNHVQYIGYTYSERKRAKVKDKNQRFPLIEFKKCEADIDRYLESIDLINPLYQNFERTGCYFCPYQKIRGFYVLWKKYPRQWRYMMDTEQRLNDIESKGQNVINSQWNIRYSMVELENAFKSGEILHEVEAPKACECGL